jgi:hypothetical protein
MFQNKELRKTSEVDEKFRILYNEELLLGCEILGSQDD